MCGRKIDNVASGHRSAHLRPGDSLISTREITGRHLQADAIGGHPDNGEGARRGEQTHGAVVRRWGSGGDDHMVGTHTPEQIGECLVNVRVAGVEIVMRAEGPSGCALVGVGIDGNDRGGASKPSTDDCVEADPAATDDADGVTVSHLCGVANCPDPGDDPTGQEAGEVGCELGHGHDL